MAISEESKINSIKCFRNDYENDLYYGEFWRIVTHISNRHAPSLFLIVFEWLNIAEMQNVNLCLFL